MRSKFSRSQKSEVDVMVRSKSQVILKDTHWGTHKIFPQCEGHSNYLNLNVKTLMARRLRHTSELYCICQKIV